MKLKNFVCDGIEWKQVRVLGKGSFGEAHLIQMVKPPESLAVCKLVHLAVMKTEERHEALNEVRVLSQLRHPNIVEFIGSFEADGYLHILMEYCNAGDVDQLLKKQGKTPLAENTIAALFIQVCSALRYMHERRILHRDLKAQNIFLCKGSTPSDGDVSEKLVAKLGDFGISTVLRHTLALAKTICGTPYYFSPELCMNRPYNNKSDTWSLGCILYEMATLKHAFDASNMKSLMQRICTGKYAPIPPQYHKSMQELIDNMLCQKVERRFSIQQVLKSAFVSQHTERMYLAHELESSEKRKERERRDEAKRQQLRQQSSQAPSICVTSGEPASPRRGGNPRDEHMKKVQERKQQQEQEELLRKQAIQDQRRRRNLRAAQNYDRHRDEIRTKISELERLDDVRRRIEICSYEDQQKYVEQGWQIVRDTEAKQQNRSRSHEERDRQLSMLLDQMRQMDEKMASRRQHRSEQVVAVPSDDVANLIRRPTREPTARELALAYKNRVSAEAPWNRGREVPVGFTKESWEAHCQVMGYAVEVGASPQRPMSGAQVPGRLPQPALSVALAPPAKGQLSDEDVSVMIRREEKRLMSDPTFQMVLQAREEENKKQIAILEWEDHKRRIREAEKVEVEQHARRVPITTFCQPSLPTAATSGAHPPLVVNRQAVPLPGFRMDNANRFDERVPVTFEQHPASQPPPRLGDEHDEADTSYSSSAASDDDDDRAYDAVIQQMKRQETMPEPPELFEEAPLPQNDVTRIGNIISAPPQPSQSLAPDSCATQQPLSSPGMKFFLDGKTLHLKGVTSTTTPAARVEALRVFLMDALGGQRSLDALLRSLKEIQCADVDESIADTMLARLEAQYGAKASLVDVAIQLMVCESMVD